MRASKGNGVAGGVRIGVRIEKEKDLGAERKKDRLGFSSQALPGTSLTML